MQPPLLLHGRAATWARLFTTPASVLPWPYPHDKLSTRAVIIVIGLPAKSREREEERGGEKDRDRQLSALGALRCFLPRFVALCCTPLYVLFLSPCRCLRQDAAALDLVGIVPWLPLLDCPCFWAQEGLSMPGSNFSFFAAVFLLAHVSRIVRLSSPFSVLLGEAC
jgi:hypothetical protein